jgi:hypothetical protein
VDLSDHVAHKDGKVRAPRRRGPASARQLHAWQRLAWPLAPRARAAAERARGGQVMHPDLLNANIKNTQYAVRGELYLKARSALRRPRLACCAAAPCQAHTAADPTRDYPPRRRRSCAARARRSSSPTVRSLHGRGAHAWREAESPLRRPARAAARPGR